MINEKSGKEIMQKVHQSLKELLNQGSIINISSSSLKKLESPPEEWVKNVQSIINKQTLSLLKNDIWYHSRRDPYREIKRILNHSDLSDKSHIIFLGTGLGYIIEEALKIKRFSSLLLIEPDLEILFYVLARGVFLKGFCNFSIFIPSEKGGEDFDALLPYLRGKALLELYIYSHPASLQAFPNLYLPIKKNLTLLIEKRMVNQATLIKFQKIWNKNIILNLREINSGGYLTELIQFKVDKTVVLAGAGPSLRLHQNNLKKYRDEFILFAVDTSYIPLLKMNIIPDLVFSSDPQWINHHYVLDSRVNKSIWVLDPAVCPAIPHWLAQNKAKMVWWDNPFYLDEFFRDSSRGPISHGGSVSTNAFDVAKQIGAKNIVLVGQDLSFTDYRAHSKGSVLEEMVFTRINRLKSIEMHNRAQLTALPLIKIKSTEKKGYTFTNAKLMIYIKWFENQARKHQQDASKQKFIHADLRGALLSGFDNISLGDFFSYQESEKKISTVNKGGFILSYLEKVNICRVNKNIEKKVIILSDQIIALIKIYAENIRLLNHYIITKNSTDIRKVEENDNRIISYKEANKIIGISAQDIILEITEKISEKNPLQVSLALYSTMQKVAKILLYLLKKTYI